MMLKTDRNPLFLVEENLVDYYSSCCCLPGAEWEQGQRSGFADQPGEVCPLGTG